MRKVLLFLFIFLSVLATAQTTTSVTATIQYPDGSVFANGSVMATFTPPTGIIDQNLYLINGSTFPYIVTGTMNGSGTFSMTLTDDQKVRPQGGRWQFTVCSLATSQCIISLQDVSGASVNLSSVINATINNIVGEPTNIKRYYTDSEVGINPAGGVMYYNLTSNTFRCYNGTTWGNCATGSGGSGTVTNIATTSPISGGPISITGTISCPTCGVITLGLNQFASTTSAQILGMISDELGSGKLIFATGLQGTDSNLMTSGTVSGTGSVLCTDANNGATTVGCPGGVTVTGSPVNGNLTKFSGAASITNGDLTGDIGTSGTLVTTLAASIANAHTFTGNITLTAGQNIASFYNTDSVLWVDNIKYASVAAAATAAGGTNKTLIIIPGAPTYSGTDCPTATTNIIYWDFRGGNICTGNIFSWNNLDSGAAGLFSMIRGIYNSYSGSAGGSVTAYFQNIVNGATLASGFFMDGGSMEADINGALTGTMTVATGGEFPVAIGSTGGTINQVNGLIAYINTNVASTTALPVAVGVYAEGCLNILGVAPSSCIGLFARQQTAASSNNFAIWAQGETLAQSAGGSSGLQPTINPASNGVMLEGDINVTGGSGTTKAYGVMGIAKVTSDVAGDIAYGGWFKAGASTNPGTEIGLHAETSDTGGTIAEFAQSTNKAIISGTLPTGTSRVSLQSTTTTTANFPMLSTTTAAVEIPSAIAYPTTITASGCLVFSSSTTQLACGGLIATNKLVKSNGAGSAPQGSSITDGAVTNLVTSTSFLTGINTIRLTANSSAITAVTPGTTVISLGALPVSTNLSFHCHILYNQQTAAVAGTGFAIQGATNAPTRLDAWAQMYTSSAGVSVEGNVANLTTTTATSLVTGTPSAITTVFQAEIDGSVQTGASATTLNLLAFTGNVSDSITVQAGSYCSVSP